MSAFKKLPKKCAIEINWIDEMTVVLIDCNKAQFYELLEEVISHLMWFIKMSIK